MGRLSLNVKVDNQSSSFSRFASYLVFLLFSSKQTPHLSDLLLFKVKLMTILSITRVVWRLQQMSRPTSRSPSRLRQPAPGNSELQPVLLDEEEEEKEDNDNNNDNVNLQQ